MEYLGLINVRQLSKERGLMYDGPAICAELLRRAGLDEDSDTWFSTFWNESYDISCGRLTVYEPGQEEVLTKQKKVKCEFLFGEIF